MHIHEKRSTKPCQLSSIDFATVWSDLPSLPVPWDTPGFVIDQCSNLQNLVANFLSFVAIFMCF